MRIEGELRHAERQELKLGPRRPGLGVEQGLPNARIDGIEDEPDAVGSPYPQGTSIEAVDTRGERGREPNATGEDAREGLLHTLNRGGRPGLAHDGRPRVEIGDPLGAREQLARIALEVEDVDATHAALLAAGYGAINPPVDVERDGAVVARAMYGLDPDGISIEIFQEFADVVKN